MALIVYRNKYKILFLSIYTLVIIGGCAVLDVKGGINLSLLKGRSGIDCHDFTLNSGDLAIKSIHFIGNKKEQHSLSVVQLRNGEDRVRFYPNFLQSTSEGIFDVNVGKNVDILEAKLLNDRVSSFIKIGSGEYAESIKHLIIGEKVNIKDVVSFVNPSLISYSVMSQEGLWLLLKELDSDFNPNKFVLYFINNETEIKKLWEIPVNSTPDIRLIKYKQLEGESVLLVWVGHDSEGKKDFLGKVIRSDGYVSKDIFFKHSLDFLNPVESWNLLSVEDKVYIVAIQGDSLMGGSGLYFISVDLVDKLSLETKIVKYIDQSNYDLGGLISINSNLKSFVFLPRWKNGEVKIAIHEVNPENNLKFIGVKGPFLKDELLEEFFMSEIDLSIWVKVRVTSDFHSKYKFCRLN